MHVVPSPAGPEGIILFVGQLRIEQRAGLDALTGGDPDVALGCGQPRAGGESSLQRAFEREGLRMRRSGQPRADEQCRRAREADFENMMKT